MRLPLSGWSDVKHLLGHAAGPGRMLCILLGHATGPAKIGSL